jgi:hypothetical protein
VETTVYMQMLDSLSFTKSLTDHLKEHYPYFKVNESKGGDVLWLSPVTTVDVESLKKTLTIYGENNTSNNTRMIVKASLQYSTTSDNKPSGHIFFHLGSRQSKVTDDKPTPVWPVNFDEVKQIGYEEIKEHVTAKLLEPVLKQFVNKFSIGSMKSLAEFSFIWNKNEDKIEVLLKNFHHTVDIDEFVAFWDKVGVSDDYKIRPLTLWGSLITGICAKIAIERHNKHKRKRVDSEVEVDIKSTERKKPKKVVKKK